VSGQEHVTQTLSNAITRDQVGHAYVFTGPRGVGKTSIARIFAKCLNCAEGPTVTPCQECQNCKEIAAGNSLAVREIDGASNNSVDNVRELIESFRTLPAPGSKYKVYIIDEVHMLSLSAFNALLKSLEEPPPHTVFILATTEPHKIPDTVLSRCQRHDLRALPISTITDRIDEISKEEGFSIEPGAAKIVAKLAEGSMRDAQTLLERARAYSEDGITTKEVSVILGSVDTQLLYTLADQIFHKDNAAALNSLQSAFAQGADEAVFLREFVAFFREMQIASLVTQDQAVEFGITSDEWSDFRELTKEIDPQDLADIVDIAREGADRALRSSFPLYALESLVVRLAARPAVKDMGKMVGRLRDMVKSQNTEKKNSAAPIVAPKSSVVLEQKEKEQESRPVPKRVPPSSSSRSTGGAHVKVLPGGKSRTKASRDPQEDSLQDSESAQQDVAQYSIEVFTEFLAAEGAVMVAELLRRVSVTKFEGGLLCMEGPAFQIQSIEKPANRERLEALLKKFSGGVRWRIQAKATAHNGTASPQSLAGREKEDQKAKLAKQREDLLQMDAVKDVMQVFPGSKIERMKLKRSR
jgi:DNA polymerase-3 subunit gamma/tau